MREIKFRAWDKDSDRMIFPSDSNEDGYPYAFVADEDGMHVESYWDGAEVGQVSKDDAHLMQYTNLKDKNGVEIYEGDIVEYYWRSNWGDRHEVRRRYEVVFDDGAFRQKEGEQVDDWDDWKDVEVIGNIYENEGILNDTL